MLGQTKRFQKLRIKFLKLKQSQILANDEPPYENG